jgi:hypothetical protein
MKIIIKTIMIATLLTISCSTRGLPKQPPLIRCEAALCPYVSMFLREAKKHKVDIGKFLLVDIKFSTLKDRKLGLSIDLLEDFRLITIDSWSFSGLTELEKEMLIAHEMGHTILHRKHRDLMLKHIPVSVMHTYFMGDKVFKGRKAYYYDELFSVSGEIKTYDDLITH